MDFKKIAFLGDSFTWGEGLELYIDNPKWISQRKKTSNWSNLLPLQDSDAKEFREANRFSALVANHFNSEIIIDSKNGGSFRSLLYQLNPLLDKGITPEVIIIQFSALSRNNIHFHLEKDMWCNCDMCSIEAKTQKIITFDYINQLMLKTLNMYDIGNPEFTYEELLVRKMLEDEFNIHHYYDNISNLFEYLKRIEYEYSRIHLDFLLEKYVNQFEKRGSYVFFIDSWDFQSSYPVVSNKKISNNMIPLLGYDGNYYKNYSSWENTFPFTRIQYEFQKCDNGHPTLLQHQYISKSIIEFLEKKELKKKINYI